MARYYILSEFCEKNGIKISNGGLGYVKFSKDGKNYRIPYCDCMDHPHRGVEILKNLFDISD